MIRKSLLPMALALSMVGAIPAAIAQNTPNEEYLDSLLESADPVQLELVQQAKGLTYADGKLTLTDPAKMTIYFADRPNRFTGQMTNSNFVELWSGSAESFAADPPNAAVLIAESDDQPAIVELKSVTLGDDGALAYDVTILSGKLPASASDVALFIDPVVYVGPRVKAYIGPAGGAAVVRRGPPPPPRGGAVIVHPRGPVIIQPACYRGPYYRHDVCHMR